MPAALAQGANSFIYTPYVAETSITEISATVTWGTAIESSSVVLYGLTESLGLSQANKVFDLEAGGESDEIVMTHSVRMQELEPGTKYFYRAQSTDASGAVLRSDIKSFTTKAAVPVCPAEPWSCSTWSACSATGLQTRTCTLKDGCAGTTIARPPLEQPCTPACDKDDWSCGEWLACSSAGKQARTCTLKFDCPTAETAKPALEQACVVACKEDVWSCSTWGSCAEIKPTDPQYAGTAGLFNQSRECTLKEDCPTVTTPKPATTQTCRPTCTEDIWSCGTWGECREGAQTRACTLKEDCPGVTTPKPEEKRACQASSCGEDAWKCFGWGDCDPGAKTQTRTCELRPECPASGSPVKPPESQSCEPSCQEDKFECGDWGACVNGLRQRSCALVFDCPADTTVRREATEEPCPTETVPIELVALELRSVEPIGVSYKRPENEPPPGEGQKPPEEKKSDITLPIETEMISLDLRSALIDLHGAAFGSTSSAGGAPEQPTDPTKHEFGTSGVQEENRTKMAVECELNGIELGRCAEWMAAKYGDKRCREAGIMTKEKCETFLARANNGVFPGCESKTEKECSAQKDRAMAGYLTNDVRDKIDEAVKKAVEENVAFTMVGVTAVSGDRANEVAWRPCPTKEGTEMASAVLVFDTDKDGVPDDVEAARGTDPKSADTDGDGVKDGDELKAGTDPKGTGKLVKKLAPVEVALINKVPLEHPAVSGEVDSGIKPFFAFQTLPTFDTTISATYTGGLCPPGTTKKSEVDLYTFCGKDDPGAAAREAACPADKAPACEVPTIPVCKDGKWTCIGPATGAGRPGLAQGGTGTGEEFGKYDVVLLGKRKAKISIDDLVTGAGGFKTPVVIGFGQTVVSGDADSVNLQGFVVNSKGAPLDLGVFGYVPKELSVLGFTGEPNTTYSVWTQSYIPLVMTVTTDEYGRAAISLDDTLGEGEHVTYVAVTDETGKVVKKSSPLSFFVREAQAVTAEDFVQSAVAAVESTASTTQPAAVQTRWFWLGAIVLVAFAGLATYLLVIRRKFGRP